jgi:DNA-binding NtrC family response regulator
MLQDAPKLSGPGETQLPLTLLIVDDDEGHGQSLEKIFERESMRVLSARDARRALEILRAESVNVVLTDLMMPGTSGLELLTAVKEVAPLVEVVLMTAYGTVEAAVSAMREGACDFVEKPLRRHSIVKSVRKAAERALLLAENRQLRGEIQRLTTSHRMIGSSPSFRQVVDTAAQAAKSSATVLILGESGTGKELLARSIHEGSARHVGPFVAVNCAAIPETILESELFGHERGAFTGAVAKRDGRFAKAAGGTLFLDEIGELSPTVQVKLLRVLQEGEYEPLGGSPTKSDVRVLAATNRDLASEVREGRFREDLFYRLNVIALTCPPLRARRDDLPLLAEHFLAVYCAKNNRDRLRIAKGAMDRMMDYVWPGNVRELSNVIERAVILSKGQEIVPSDLPPTMAASDADLAALTISIGTPLAEVEQRVIQETLRRTKGDKVLAAQLLGISARTIYRKLDGYDG